MLSKAIRTERLLLRPAAVQDAEALDKLQTWKIAQWLASVPWPRTLEDLRVYLIAAEAENSQGISANYVIEHEGAPCGMITLHPRDGAYSLGYWLGEDYWGQGLMSEAAEAFVDAFFAETTAVHIISGVFAGNEISQRIQRRLGFATVGETMRFIQSHNKRLPFYQTVLGRQRRTQVHVAQPHVA